MRRTTVDLLNVRVSSGSTHQTGEKLFRTREVEVLTRPEVLQTTYESAFCQRCISMQLQDIGPRSRISGLRVQDHGRTIGRGPARVVWKPSGNGLDLVEKLGGAGQQGQVSSFLPRE